MIILQHCSRADLALKFGQHETLEMGEEGAVQMDKRETSKPSFLRAGVAVLASAKEKSLVG